MDILVEMHDVFQPGASQQLIERFTATHEIEQIAAGARNPADFSLLEKMPHLDQWIAIWEWRGGPTPWSMMRAKSRVT